MGGIPWLWNLRIEHEASGTRRGPILEGSVVIIKALGRENLEKNCGISEIYICEETGRRGWPHPLEAKVSEELRIDRLIR